MPAIPEFVLRKLFVPNSLKALEGGFSFQLNNTFGPVTLVGMAVWSDDVPAGLEGISLALPDQAARPASGISPAQPLLMVVNQVLSVQVLAPLPRKKLTLRAETREAGPLQFSINVGSGARAARPASATLQRSIRRVSAVWKQRHVQTDPQLPHGHFTPPMNWMNDPNGLVDWQGHYHLFYQHNPDEAVWGNMHWGHAVSSDLIHWKHLPVALAPSPDGPDAGGCFSGCAVIDGEQVAFVYTGVFPETQCLATSRSALLTRLEKRPAPVIPAPPAGLDVEGFRDPCVWREGDEWRMVLGSGLRGQGGAILLYRSPDLVAWEYLGILCQGDAGVREPLWSGTMWECPSFFPLGDRWVLVISACAQAGPLYTIYFVGAYRANRFIPQGGPYPLDFGANGCFYAPQTFVDRQGRRLMIGWLREGRSVEAQRQAGWSGAMALPRVLSLAAGGTLAAAPVPEVAQLRGGHERGRRSPGEPLGRGPVEILAELPPSDTWCGLRLAAGASAQERIEIGYDPYTAAVVVDARSAGGTLSRCPYPPGRALKLHIFVDASVLEVFVEDRLPIATRFYAQDPAALRVGTVGNATYELWRKP